MLMHKGQQRKIKVAICNVPVECHQTCNQLPHPADRSCIIILKLKRKLQSRDVYFQASRPEVIKQVLNNINSNLTTLQNDSEDNDTHQQATSNNVTTNSDPALEFNARENDILASNEEENDDPLN